MKRKTGKEEGFTAFTQACKLLSQSFLYFECSYMTWPVPASGCPRPLISDTGDLLHRIRTVQNHSFRNNLMAGKGSPETANTIWWKEATQLKQRQNTS